ncbi:MAG: tRNA guanosine(34) transglycosylase Tgt [bacterium]|nr:tRNA guanosine(34) transglycosylase Tgt [bacterium]
MEDKFFTLKKKDGEARLGRLKTARFEAETPIFMPVGTQATVKGLYPWDVAAIGFPIILSNTYHLYLRPGHKLIRQMGGLHKFMKWDRGILTDSGGFQAFSLRERIAITDEGIRFRSHLDGSEHMFSPESVIEFQESFGSDIMMPIDECIPPDATHSYVENSIKRTNKWAFRCLNAKTTDQHLFGIVQGGMYPDLRKVCAETLAEGAFSGFSVGGLSIGEEKPLMYSVLEETTPHIPQDKPRYLMGVGAPEDLVEGVARGIDMFDCVLPTRTARSGTFMVPDGKLVIKNARHKYSDIPIEEGCPCYACRNFSRAYLRHLFMADEMLGPELASIHNLTFLYRLMESIRDAIRNDRFDEFRKSFLERYFSDAERK